MPTSVVRWPAGTAPEGAPIHTWNALDIAAPPERVWPWLVRPLTWPTYYDNASTVRFLDGGGPELALRTRFRWKTFGVTVETVVTG